MTDKKTIRVRIAVAVTPNGCWDTHGSKLNEAYRMNETQDERDADDAKYASCYIFEKHGAGHVVFVECDVPLPDTVPESVTIEGKVQQ